MKDHPSENSVPAGAQIESLQREKEALSQQVKRLIRAEGKLYEYQQELDVQLKQYKELYELNRRLNDTSELETIFRETVTYVTEQLEYERAVLFRRSEESGLYQVSTLAGYFDEAELEGVAALTVDETAACLSPLLAGAEYLICKPETRGRMAAENREKLLMNEYFIYPLGFPPLPHALLAVGNSAENAQFYRRVTDSPGALLGMGNLVGLISSLIENRISFRQMEQARQQERLAEAKYRSIFENAVEGIFQRTPEGRYLDVNRALARTLGYGSPQELIEAIADIRGELYLDPRQHDQLFRLVHDRGSVEGFETRMRRRDGAVIWVSISMRLVRDDAGAVLFYEGTTEEVTKRKEAEEALRESEQKYRQLSEALEQRVQEAVAELREKDRILILQGRQAVMGEMISNIAHQWRQPLNMLALLVQDLQMTQKKEGLSDQFVEDNVRRSLEIIRQMSKTIDYFRYFFRSDTEQVEFRVLETIEKTLSLLEGSLNMHGIKVELDHAGDPVVCGFPTEFVQVLLNLLINARDALVSRGTASPRITVRLSSEGERTVLTIADNAGGIPAGIIDRIFEPYFTTKGPEQGTGIGLFMCKTIIEKNMHGRLSVRNLAEGAEFRIEV